MLPWWVYVGNVKMILWFFNPLKALETLAAINTPKTYTYPVKIKRLLDTCQGETEKTQDEPGAFVV